MLGFRMDSPAVEVTSAGAMLPLAYYISGCVYNTVTVLWQLCCLLVPCIIGGDRSRWNLSLYLRRRFPTKGAVNKLPACVCLSVCLLECLFLSLPFILFVSVAVPYILNQWVPKCQITRLQRIQNSLARAVVKAPKFSRTTPIIRSLHWLKITERIEYKLLSLTYKVLTTTQPSYLHNLITVQPPRSTRS